MPDQLSQFQQYCHSEAEEWLKDKGDISKRILDCALRLLDDWVAEFRAKS